MRIQMNHSVYPEFCDMIAIGLTAGFAGRRQSQSAVKDRFNAVLFDRRRFLFERPDSQRVAWPIDSAPESFTRRGLKEFSIEQEEKQKKNRLIVDLYLYRICCDVGQ